MFSLSMKGRKWNGVGCLSLPTGTQPKWLSRHSQQDTFFQEILIPKEFENTTCRSNQKNESGQHIIRKERCVLAENFLETMHNARQRYV